MLIDPEKDDHGINPFTGKPRLSQKEKMSRYCKQRWANASDEFRKMYSERTSKAMKKRWKTITGNSSTMAKMRAALAKCPNHNVETKEVPRVNTYAGVLTESDLVNL